jgi:hypothetical protein
MSSGIGPVAAALIGAGGAIIGGALTSSAQLVADWRQAARQRATESTRRSVEWRQAVRLILDELREAELLIREATGARRFWERPRQLSTSHWQKYSPHLAAYLEDDSEGDALWQMAASAFSELNRMNWVSGDRWRIADRIADANGDSEPSRARIWPSDNTRLAWRAVRRAIRGLAASLGQNSLDDDGTIETELWPYGDADEFKGEPDVDWFDPGERW